jgi:hypothetical protein
MLLLKVFMEQIRRLNVHKEDYRIFQLLKNLININYFLKQNYHLTDE